MEQLQDVLDGLKRNDYQDKRMLHFFKIIGDKLNKWPNNAYFNCGLLFLYLSFDPMPHTSAYQAFLRSPVGKALGLYVPQEAKDEVKARDETLRALSLQGRR